MSPDAQTLAELVRRALAEDVGDGDVTSQATVAGGHARRRDDHPEGGRRRVRPRRRRGDVPRAGRRRRARAARSRGAVARAAGAGAARDRRRPRAARRRAHGAELPAAPVGRRDADGALRARRRGDGRADPRHAQDDAGPADAGEGGGRRGRRRQPPRRASTTWCSSRRTTRRWPAASGPRCAPPRRRIRDLPLEVECSTLAEVDEALAAGATRILLDNMGPPELRAAVAHVAGRARLEASGGIGFDTLRAHAETGVDWISIGALTHSAPALDLSLLSRRCHDPASALRRRVAAGRGARARRRSATRSSSPTTTSCPRSRTSPTTSATRSACRARRRRRRPR